MGSTGPTFATAPRLHEWHVEAREYARQESRRGRRHAFERLEADRTALVVVDMVPFFVAEGGYCAGIVPNIARLAKGLRDAGGTIAWVLPGDVEPSLVDVEFRGAAVARMYASTGGEGPLRERVWHEFDVDPGDLVVEKTASSAFFPGRSALPSLLAERGIDTVIVAGTVANVCCESTVRDASTLGHRVIMVADGNAALRDQDLNATLHTVYRSFGDVRSTGDILAMIAAADHGAGDR